jgi:hydrogenase nickel incorporation protein HypA/HybF
MHELSLADNIVRLVQEAAQREQFDAVALLRLEAGALAGVELHALRFALAAIVHGTCLEGAQIEIETSAGRAWCPACNTEIAVESRIDPCPQCGGAPVKILSGTHLRVRDLLVRQEPRTPTCV